MLAFDLFTLLQPRSSQSRAFDTLKDIILKDINWNNYNKCTTTINAYCMNAHQRLDTLKLAFVSELQLIVYLSCETGVPNT